MPAVVRSGALLAFLVFSGACDRPTFPSLFSPQPPSSSQPPPAGQPQPSPTPPPIEQPPLTGPGTTYVFSGPLSYQVSGFTTASKYVLYDNGAFALQYASFSNPYPGVYRQENGGISFDFGANGSSDASGVLNGDLLEVRYSEQMQHSDFENAVYRRSQ